MTRPTQTSKHLNERSEKLFPGGVNSPVRAFRAVGGEPPIIVRAKGSRMWDADGNEYLDYVLSWGPLVLGHAPRVVLDALREAMVRGTSFGIPVVPEVWRMSASESGPGSAAAAEMPAGVRNVHSISAPLPGTASMTATPRSPATVRICGAPPWATTTASNLAR